MQSLTQPNGSVTTYQYDVLNRLTAVTDPQGETATCTYDMAGMPAIFTHFKGIVTTYTCDMASRLLGMGSIVSNYQYTLDDDGNRIDSAETEPLAATPSEAAISYGYNAQKNRLLSAGALSYNPSLLTSNLLPAPEARPCPLTRSFPIHDSLFTALPLLVAVSIAASECRFSSSFGKTKSLCATILRTKLQMSKEPGS